PLREDVTLPPGWTRKVTQRQMGKSAGKYDVYIFSPSGKKFRSRTDLASWVEKNDISDVNPYEIDFSVRGVNNKSVTPAKKKKKTKKVTPKITPPKGSPKGAKTAAGKLVIKMDFKKRPSRKFSKGLYSDVEEEEDDRGYTSIRDECNNNDCDQTDDLSELDVTPGKRTESFERRLSPTKRVKVLSMECLSDDKETEEGKMPYRNI
ncbi:hypothetical protein CAPTEDRAFT_102897, partial [Capitella teleta]